MPGEQRLIIATCEKGTVEDVNDMRQIKAGLDAVKKANPNFVEICAREPVLPTNAPRVADPLPEERGLAPGLVACASARAREKAVSHRAGRSGSDPRCSSASRPPRPAMPRRRPGRPRRVLLPTPRRPRPQRRKMPTPRRPARQRQPRNRRRPTRSRKSPPRRVRVSSCSAAAQHIASASRACSTCTVAPRSSWRISSRSVVPADNIVFSDYTTEELYKEGAKRGAIDPCFPSKIGIPARAQSAVSPAQCGSGRSAGREVELHLLSDDRRAAQPAGRLPGAPAPAQRSQRRRRRSRPHS